MHLYHLTNSNTNSISILLVSCASYSHWPNIAVGWSGANKGITCGNCLALVQTNPYDGRCSKYCQSFGHICAHAAEEKDDNCMETSTPYNCDDTIIGDTPGGTSDMLCTCIKPTSKFG